MNAEKKIQTVEDLAEIRRRLRAEGRVVVQCHGCFDIVHPGHLRYLRFAREQGDVLVVSVTSDTAVGKGPDRPYIGEDLRLENLAAIEYVDYVCLDDHEWAGPILDALQPDVYVKGKEYEQSSNPRFAREKELVEGYGGKVIFSSGEVVYSSTFILSRFRERFQLEEDRVRSFARRHEITRARLTAALERMVRKRVLVIGDPILDRYVHCDALAVAAESPILSVMPLREDVYPGAGALIARQIAALGGEPIFLTTVSEGGDTAQFASELERAGIELVRAGADPRPLYEKTRFLVEESKVFKVNRGRFAPLSTTAARDLVAGVEGRLRDVDAVIATDFGYGLFGGGVAESISKLAQAAARPLYVDVSQSARAHLLGFARPRLATPTEPELRLALGDEESGISNLASRYYAETGAGGLVITLGKRGVVIFDPPGMEGGRLSSDYLPALSRSSIDAVGAGDVFLATAALADLAEETLPVATFLASCASSLHVARLGNEPVDLADLLRFVAGRPELG